MEQLRHLLTKHDGRIALDQLETIYIAEFGVPSRLEVHKYIRKKLPHFSFHVVNLASYKWAVWSPTGYPCCPQRWTGEVLTSELLSSSASGAHSTFVVSDGERSASSTVISEQVDPSASFVDDLVDLSDTAGGEAWPEQEKMAPFSDFASVSNSMSSALDQDMLAVAKGQKMDDLIDLSDVLDVSAGNMMEDAGDRNFDDLSFASVSMPPFDTRTSTANSAPVDPNPAPEAPFDFLKHHPDLIAELSMTDCPLPADDLTVLAEVLTLQRLQELGFEMPHGMGGPSPQVPPVSKEEEVPVLPPEGCSQPVDYLGLGWSPSRVLAELQRQKEGCGGILPPDKMEPFLDYFGEMSSRELERIESLEGKPKPKKSVAGKRKKRNMAIRFPNQSKTAPSESHQQEYPTYDVGIPAEQLPVANIENSSSDSSEGSSAVPLDRSEYIRKFLRGKNLPNDFIDPDVLLGVLESEEKDANTASASGSGLGWESLT